MGKRTIRALVLALGVTALAGATGAAAQTAAGLRAGYRMADLDTGEDVEGVEGLVVGGYFGIGLSDRLALQIELAYGERGAESVKIGAGELDPAAPPSSLSMRYLDVPVLLRTGFPSERFLPSFFIGPYAGFLLGCDMTTEGGETRDCDLEEASSRFSPRSTDFGVVAGGALDMAIGDNTIFIDARYTLGLLSISSEDGLDARHNGLEISGGFAFPLGR